MAKILTAERVSRDISDNYVFQRSQLAYHEAARRISGDVLEIGTGTGYGIEIVAPHASSFHARQNRTCGRTASVPARGDAASRSSPSRPAVGRFDYVISFQVIEHIKHDMELVREVHRVLRPGGKFILTTPQYPHDADTQPLARQGNTIPTNSATCSAAPLRQWRPSAFSAMNGSWNTTKKTAKAFGASPVSTCSTYNTGCPGGCCNSPTTCSTASTADAYSGTTTPLTRSITMEDYRIGPVADDCFDLFYIAEKQHK